MKTKQLHHTKMKDDIFQKYHLPFIKQYVSIRTIKNILEIGKSRIGALDILRENDCYIISIDIEDNPENGVDKKLIADQLFSAINEQISVIIEQNTFFDLIIISDSLIQASGKKMIMEKLMRVLEPQGAIFISFRAKSSFFRNYSLEKFRDFITCSNYFIKAEKLYLIDPILCVRHNFEPYEVADKIKKIPYIRNFFSAYCSYIISKEIYHVQAI